VAHQGTKIAGAALDHGDAVVATARNPHTITDAVARIEEKNSFVARELAAWRDLAASTEFPQGS
jgi:hypothetical protein